jgi:O-antigen/teichoic acid export membrane protein
MLALLRKNKGALSYMSVLVADRITGLILIYFLIRYSSSENFSFWTQVHFLPGAVCGILGLGFGRGILRIFVDNNISQKVVSLAIYLSSFTYLLICILAYLLILYIDNSSVNRFMGGESNTYLGILMLSIFIVLEGFFEILLNFLRAKISHSFVFFSALRIIPRVIAVLSIVAFEVDFWFSIYIYILGSTVIISQLFFTVSKTIKDKHPRKDLDSKEFNTLIKKLSRYSIPVMISAIAFPVLNIFVREYVIQVDGYDQLGVFAIYMSFIGMIIYFPEAFQNYIFPKLVSMKNKSKDKDKDKDKEKRNILKQLRYVMIFSAFSCLVFVFIGPYLLDIIYPKTVWTSIDSFSIAITAFFWTFYFTMQRIYLIYFPLKTEFLTYITFISCALALTLVYAELISGPLNAVLGVMIFYLVSLLLIIILFKKNHFFCNINNKNLI